MRRLLLALLLLALPTPAYAAIAHVQTVCKDKTDGGNPSTTMAVTLTTTSGSLLVVNGATDSASTSPTLSVASSPSETYSVTASLSDLTPPSAAYQWFAANVASGSHTVTMTSTGSDYLHLCVMEFSGAATSTPLDKTAGPNEEVTTTTPTSTATATTAQADEVLVGFHAGAYAGGAQGWTPGSSYTIPAACSLRDSVCQYRIVSSTGAYASTITSSITGPAWKSIIGTYKAAAGTTPKRHRVNNQ